MKNLGFRIVMLSVIILGVAGVAWMSTINTPERKLTNFVKDGITEVLEQKECFVIVREQEVIKEYEVARDSLAEELEVYRQAAEYDALGNITDPNKVFETMGKLRYLGAFDRTIMDMYVNQFQYVIIERQFAEKYANIMADDSAAILQRIMYDKKREFYLAEVAKAEKIKPFACIEAETNTLLAKIKRGMLNDEAYTVYHVNVEIPMTDRISFLSEFDMNVYPGEYPLIMGKLSSLKTGFQNFKASHNCN